MLSCSKTGLGLVQNSWMTSMKGFDPIQMLTTVYFVYMLVCGECTGTVAAIASSKWMLYTGGSEERFPDMIVKHFGCTVVHMKVLYKCLIHSYCFCQ